MMGEGGVWLCFWGGEFFCESVLDLFGESQVLLV